MHGTKLKCDFNKAINMHSRRPTEQHFYVLEPRCGYLLVVKKVSLCPLIEELFVKPKNEFMSELSNNCDVTELRYVRDMMYPMVKRCTSAGQLGQLVDRKSGDHLKDKLIKDIYNLYLVKGLF